MKTEDYNSIDNRLNEIKESAINEWPIRNAENLTKEEHAFLLGAEYGAKICMGVIKPNLDR